MERQEFDFKAEVIKERAETGSSFYCAICQKEKKTKKSKTCQGCSRKYPGAAKAVDLAVEKYQQSAKTIARVDKIFRLSRNGWEILQEEIWDKVEEVEKKGKKCPDRIIVEALIETYPDFSYGLCQSAVQTFRIRQKGRGLFYRIFDINDHYPDKEALVDEILETDGRFSREMISHIVDEQVLIEMKKLVKGKVTARDLDLDLDPKKRIHKRAVQISNDNSGIYGFFFKKLMRAVAEEMQELEESLERNESEKREREKVHKEKRTERKIKQDDRRREILSRPRVDLWTRSGQKKFGFIVHDKDEAALLNDKTIVVLDECTYQVVKINGGNVKLKHSNLLFSDPMSQSSQSVRETNQERAAKLNTAWVMCEKVASEAVEVFRLTDPQMKDKKLISGLPPNSYVVGDVVHINNVPLFEVRSGTLIKIGPCRQASRQERNSSDEYLPQINHNS